MNPDSITRSSDMFTTYDGGGLDMTVLGGAEIDPCGNVNVSKFLRPLRGSRRLYQHLPEHAEGLLRFLLHLR